MFNMVWPAEENWSKYFEIQFPGPIVLFTQASYNLAGGQQAPFKFNFVYSEVLSKHHHFSTSSWLVASAMTYIKHQAFCPHAARRIIWEVEAEL